MFYVDKNNVTFDVTLTLGDVATITPPALRLSFERKGTNETGSYDIPGGQVTPGERFVTIDSIPTNIFAGSGQYNYSIFDIDVPATPVLIESGLFEVLTDDPITKTEYGTEKERGEYKGHI
jgi:hypothetical protein